MKIRLQDIGDIAVNGESVTIRPKTDILLALSAEEFEDLFMRIVALLLLEDPDAEPMEIKAPKDRELWVSPCSAGSG